jgi:hypothetical protein
MAITKVYPGSINAPLGALQESGVNAFGGVNILKVKGLSSDILSASATNIATVSGGDIEIENIIVLTDATGLTGGTNLEFLTDDTIGLAVFWSEAISGLGANAAIDINTASVTKQRTVIHSGKHLQIQCTAAPCTGAGVWEAFIVYRPCVQTAVLQ